MNILTYKKNEALKGTDDLIINACDYTLCINGNIFNPENDEKISNQLKNNLRGKFFEFFYNLSFANSIAFRLSWHDLDLDEILKVYLGDERCNIIFQYHNWKTDENNGSSTEEECQLIFECLDKSLAQEIFEKFWFPILMEWKMEWIILAEENISKLLNWSYMPEGDQKNNLLMEYSQLVLNNQHNGFHFQSLSKYNLPKIEIEDMEISFA